MKKRAIILILILVVALLAIYFTFFYTKKCGDRGCFNLALQKCSRVSYLNDAEDTVWLYKIKGKEKGGCEVYVKLVKLKTGATDIVELEGKDMNCYPPLGIMRDPQDDLGKCSGKLKEEMQTLIINRLHAYIVENLGQISEELKEPLA